MQFLDGSTPLGTASLSGGSASLTTASLAAGTHSLTAVYSGDGNNASSTSAILTQAVKSVAAITLQASATVPSYGQSMPLTASVSPAAATGTIQFLDGTSSLGTVAVGGGTASLTISTFAVGSHTLTAVYGGDADDTAGTSAAVAVTVSQASAGATLAPSLNPSVAGQSVTFTATVSPSSATGTVQFLDGSTSLGTVALSAGSAALSTSSLSAGSHTITATYSGNVNYKTASASVSQTVSAPPPGAPSNLTATAASSSQINLSWTASATSGVTYNVYSSTTSGFVPSASNKIASGIATTGYSHTGLTASTTHYYVVTAQNSAGESTASNQAASGVSCHVAYTVTTQWNVGFGTAINGWKLSWTWPNNQQITQAWNSSYTQTGTSAALANASWNATIAPGATLSGMGFNGSYSGTNTSPTAFYVNGTLCH